MTVYILERVDDTYEQSFILGVFKSEAIANSVYKSSGGKNNSELKLKEIEVTDHEVPKQVRDGLISFRVQVYKDGSIRWIRPIHYKEAENSWKAAGFNRIEMDEESKNNTNTGFPKQIMNVHAWAQDEKEAIKLSREFWSELIVLDTWPQLLK